VKIIVVGGGAAGFFSALSAKQHNPAAEVLLMEKSAKLLSKVRVSGGGRCNVTHSCFDPRKLVRNYPRGHRELLGPFHIFQPEDTVAWFRERGVELKTEGDGRMFPITDSSSTIIDCFVAEAEKLGVEIRIRQKIDSIIKNDEGFLIAGERADAMILATGNSPQGHEAVQKLGHTVQKPVPSLFTFNVPSSPLLDLSGLSVAEATLSIAGSSFSQTGPLLLTHWGFSGPAALKLSAWAARDLAEKKYEVTLQIDWLPQFSAEQIAEQLQKEAPAGTLGSLRCFGLPKKLWRSLVEEPDLRLAELGKARKRKLIDRLKKDPYEVRGKTTNKEEFVTCGGVTLSEVNFKRMESRICPGLHLAGEILDIDGVTGGFNFQNAWTTGWIAGKAASEDMG
jgi:predicted Rossmann fold flavoprotein